MNSRRQPARETAARPQGAALETRRLVRIRRPPTLPQRPGPTSSAWSNTWPPSKPGTSARSFIALPRNSCPGWQDSNGSDLWATEDETRDQVIGFYQRTWDHSDATINELPLLRPRSRAVVAGAVCRDHRCDHGPCPRRVHPHAGHADILREGLDGRTGLRAELEADRRGSPCAAYCAKIERAARSAAPIEAY